MDYSPKQKFDAGTVGRIDLNRAKRMLKGGEGAWENDQKNMKTLLLSFRSSVSRELPVSENGS